MLRATLWALVYLTIVCLPLLTGWLLDLPPRSVRNELASGLGLLAFSIILVEFVLSGRFRTVSNTLGLDITIRFHQLMGGVALVFALVHPFVYKFLPGPPRPWDPTRELTITSDFWAILPGILAFVLLPTFVLASIYRDELQYKYERWRLVHGFGALLIAVLLLLHAEAAGRYSAEPAVAWMWRGLTSLAVLSLIHVYIAKPLYQMRHRWRVSRVERLTPRQWDLRIVPDGHDGASYQAGQFVWLNVGHSPFSLNENPFSISSAPSDNPEMGFVIKELGDFTGALDQVAVGDKAYIDSAHGTLTIDGRSERDIIMIAGGVGVAPMLGILRKIALDEDRCNAVLIYGNRTSEQIVFRDELDELDQSEWADVVHVLSEPQTGWSGETGFIDGELLDRILPKHLYESGLFVLCGPPIMLTLVEKALIDRGVSAHRILSERFQYD
ncbi:ferredoxin reductase family protein [uncultured Tateyamaria sp.]|uniref:ferredoxin reductase family protein n=1 Tax=uncultured Tateyamaria sp. TaxID=455651 RepID=UPI00262D2A85|nr:ferredoxin reductase family protein [uncultured Tateyamaria sp.]